MARNIVSGLGCAVASFMIGCAAHPVPADAMTPLALTFRGSRTLDLSNVSDQHGVSFTIAGLSGITYLGADEYLCAMDNADTLVRVRLIPSPNATLTTSQVLGGLRLAQLHDHEGLALAGFARNSVLVSEEDTPAIREYSLGALTPPPAPGAFVRTLALPASYANRRANFGLESLAIRLSPAASSIGGTGATVFTCNEEALTTDGPQSTPSAGTLVRITRITLDSGAGAVTGQWAYLTEPMHGGSITGARSGVCDLVALPDGRVILLERSLALNFAGFFQGRLYELDFTGATDVSAMPAIPPPSGPFVRVSKRLLWSGDLANLEGIALGPRLPDGSYVLVGIVDDNGSATFDTVASWQLTGVQPPNVADFDWSGTVDATDLFAYLDAWFTQTDAPGVGLPTDIDDSGDVDVSDLFAFLDAWFAKV
jgi:hypothetical protein